MLINFLKEEVQILSIKQKLELLENQNKIKAFQKLFEDGSCSELPIAFWEHKRHEVYLPYQENFHKSQILMKVLFNKEIVSYYQNEIQDLIKKII